MADLNRPDMFPEGEGFNAASMKLDPHFQVAVLVLGLLPAFVLHGGDSGVLRPEGVSSKPGSPAMAVEVPELKLPSNVELPDAVKGLAANFRTQAQNYVDRQKELWKRSEGASKTERDQLKEQLKANRVEFLQQTRQLRAELKERIKELQKSLNSSRPLDESVGERGGRGRRGR